MTFSPSLMEFFPDGNYHVDSGLAKHLGSMDGTEVVWLPFSPGVTEQLAVDGLFKLEQWSQDELKYDRHIKEGVRRMFEETVLAEQPYCEQLAIITQARNGEVLARQVWAKAQPDTLG